MNNAGSVPPLRILFNGHDFKFLRPVISYYKNNPGYDVLIDEHGGHVITDIRKSEELLANADIIFCEWCLGNAEWYSNRKKNSQILIIRLHHQEIGLHYLEKIKWKNVDRIVFICQNNMSLFLHRFPFMADRAVLVYNPIESDSFDLPKLYGAEFNLGFIGAVPKRKSLHMAFELLTCLKEIDRRYTLFIKGKHPWDYDWLWRQPEERRYFEDLYSRINSSVYANSVIFDPHGNDVPEWFSKVGFILSTSDHEGSHQSIAEGMASGAIPVIRNWAGADLLYPKRFVFKTVEEAVGLIVKWNTDEHYLRESEDVKKYARGHFDKSKILAQYDELFKTLLKEKENQDNNSALAAQPTMERTAKGVSAMHVCYINPGNQSGYETRIIEETRLLQNSGFQIIIACFIKSDQTFSGDELLSFRNRLEEITGANVYIFPTNHYFDLSPSAEGTTEIVSSLVSLAKLRDVKIIHGQALYSTMHALRANEKIGAKVIFDVHGASPEESEMSGEHANRVSVLTGWEKEALRKSDMRIFVSNRMKNFFEKKYGLPELPHVVIPCCVHPARFAMAQETRDKRRELLGLKDKFVLMYLGTLSVWQWPEAMFSFFSQFHARRPDTFFYLLLPRADHVRARSFIERQGLPEDIFIIEEVPHSEMGAVAGIADAGLLLRKAHPVNYVSSPTKLGEYLAAGVPVIATDDIGDTSGIIRAEKTGVIVAATDNGLSQEDLERIIGFSRDVQRERRCWAERCMSVSKNILDWNIHGKALADIYNEISSGERRPVRTEDKKMNKFLESERIFIHNAVSLKYVLFEEKSSPDLLISFSAFAVEGARYNYVRTLESVKCNKLYILDEYGPDGRGCYYLGGNRNFVVASAVVALINEIAQTRGIKRKIAYGSSKGGWAALYFGFSAGCDYIISGAPQSLIGNYLTHPAHMIFLEFIAGGVRREDIDFLNGLLYEKIDTTIGKPIVFIHVGREDHHYKEHVLPLIDIFKKHNVQYHLDLCNYSGHEKTAEYFPIYLQKIINEILNFA